MADWEQELDAFLAVHDGEVQARAPRRADHHARVVPYFQEVVIPALETLKRAFDDRRVPVLVDANLDGPDATFAKIVFGSPHLWTVQCLIKSVATARAFSLFVETTDADLASVSVDISEPVLNADDPREVIIRLVLSRWQDAVIRQRETRDERRPRQSPPLAGAERGKTCVIGDLLSRRAPATTH